jgi:hypothetical protein
VRTRASDRNRQATGNTQLASRAPMFVLAFPGELLALAVRTPAPAPLFQLPPTISNAGRLIHPRPVYTA